MKNFYTEKRKIQAVNKLINFQITLNPLIQKLPLISMNPSKSLESSNPYNNYKIFRTKATEVFFNFKAFFSCVEL